MIRCLACGLTSCGGIKNGLDYCMVCIVCKYCDCVFNTLYLPKKTLACCGKDICNYCAENKMHHYKLKFYCKMCRDGYSGRDICDFTQKYPIYDLLAKYKIHYMDKLIISYLRM